MSFILETTDMDLGDTLVENIFINDFMPMANGTDVKVYLLGYKYANAKDLQIEITNHIIAKHLEIPLDDVLRAWDFWEKKGIIEKIKEDKDDKYNYKIKFLNLKQLYIKNNLSLFSKKEDLNKKSDTVTPKELIEANQIPQVNQMFNDIDDIMRRQTVVTEKQKILSWIKLYNMNPDVIVKAFSYGIERKGKKSINYIEGIIRNWYDNDLTNMEALLEYFKTQDEKYYRYERVLRALGFNRSASEGEMKTIDKWFDEYGFSMEIVLKACESSSKTSNPSINYIDGIISSWHKKGIKELDEIEEKDKPKEKKTFSPRQNQARSAPLKTRFHNFKQRTDEYSEDELEAIARKKRESYQQKIKGES